MTSETLPPDDFLQGHLGLKLKQLQRRFAVIQSRLKARLELYHQQIQGIDDLDLEIGNRILSMEEGQKSFPNAVFPLLPILNQRKYDLRRERHSAHQDLWRDMNALLPEYLQAQEALEQATQRAKILGIEPPGDEKRLPDDFIRYLKTAQKQ